MPPSVGARRAESFDRLTRERSASVEVDLSKSEFRLDLRPKMGRTPLSWLPRVMIEPPAPFVVTRVEERPWGRGTRRVTVREEREPLASFSPFSVTSKMAAPSFSLPAGPRGAGGGTCPASALRAIPGRAFVCHACYALHGHYLYAEQYALREARLRWVLKLLRRPGSFAEAMVRAIEEVHDRPPGHAGQWNLSFFRVHDSGDFMGSPRYVREWNQIARHFGSPRAKRDGTQRPPMRFWAPTRDWVFFPEVVEGGLPRGRGDVPPTRTLGAAPSADLALAMRRASSGGECPDNFAIRPSALHVGDEPPRVDGLAAGSTVLQLEQVGSGADGVERCGYEGDSAHCHCPAYERSEPWTLAGNCEDARCRTCWGHDRSVDYAEK